MVDKEMQLPDGFAKQLKFALENLMFELRQRARLGDLNVSPFANAVRYCAWVISHLSVALCSPCPRPGFGTSSATDVNHCRAVLPILDLSCRNSLEMTSI